MDLFADLKRITEAHLRTQGVSIKPNETLEDLLMVACNLELKTIKAQPRSVHQSREFVANLARQPKPLPKAAAAILRKFEIGENVNPHLSKKSSDPRKSDLLLFDWGIHHLHISNHKVKKSDPFFARTGPIMFVWVRPNEAFFIDVYPHGKGYPEAFTRDALLRIVEGNWPHLLDPYRLKGVTAVSRPVTDADRQDLRAGSVNTFVDVGGSFVMGPGMGFMSNGDPAISLDRADETMITVRDLEDHVKENEKALKQKIASKHGLAESTLDFELVALDRAWGVAEKRTDTLVVRVHAKR